MLVNNCPCGTSKTYASCCEIIHQDAAQAITAVQLMRARYSAHVLRKKSFIIATNHASTRHHIDEKELQDWLRQTKWLSLKVFGKQAGAATDTKGKVRFKAYYQDEKGKKGEHHELSTFWKENGQWYFVGGEEPPKHILKKKNNG